MQTTKLVRLEKAHVYSIPGYLNGNTLSIDSLILKTSTVTT